MVISDFFDFLTGNKLQISQFESDSDDLSDCEFEYWSPDLDSNFPLIFLNVLF